MKRRSRLLFLLVLGVSFTAPSLADSGNPLPGDDRWRFTVAFPMIWAPQINGKIRGGEPIDFTVEFNDVLENLKFGLMGELYANKGRYGLAFRTSYMRVEDENSRHGLADTRVRTNLEMGVNDLAASFRVHDNVRVVTGVRHILAKLDLDLLSTIGETEILNEQVTVTDTHKFDLLVGVNLTHWLTDRWGIMLNSDIGIAGDNDRDFSAEFRALVRLGDLNNFWFGYRYLTIGSDTETDGTTYSLDMTQLGPTLGWAFTF